MVKKEENTVVTSKNELVSASIKNIEKKYGKGSIMKLGDAPSEFPHISTGILPLDIAIGIGGFPKGRVIEIFGPEASGKTTIALHAVAQAQKEGGICAYIDAENAMNPDFAERIGVDIDNLIFVQPSSGEEGLDITEELIKSNGISIIVVDSVAALVPQAELDGEISDANIGLQARMMSKAMRKIISAVNKSETIVIFINQLREKVGVMFGNPETTPGGRALSFYASLRLDVRKVEQIKDGKDVVGNKVKVTVRKNKVGSPFKVAIFDLMFSDGVSMSGSVLDLGVDYGFVEKSGAWFSYNGTRIGQGREAAKSWFENNEEEMIKLREKILEEVSAH